MRLAIDAQKNDVHVLFRSLWQATLCTVDRKKPPSALLLPNEVFRIQGAVFEVSRSMGRGFLEAVYQECLALELASRCIPFQPTPSLRLAYKGRPLKQTYSPDFICFDAIIVELKAARELAPEHRAQVLNYLRATSLEVGLLVNFGCAPRATVERLVLQKEGTANGRE
jgi:GxxExxY protein